MLEIPQDSPVRSHTRGMCWAQQRTQIRHCPRSPQALSPTLGDVPTLGSREGCGEWMGLRPGAKPSTPVEPAPLSPGMSLCKAGRARSSQKDAECSGKQELPTLSFPYSPSGRYGMSQILKIKSRAAQQLSQPLALRSMS